MGISLDISKRLDSFTLEAAFQTDAETVGLLGASGCGKSMTLRCIAGIERPDEGRIVVNGVTYFDSAARINLTPQQRKTALLFQNYQLIPHMTVEDNIAIGITANVDDALRRALVAREMARFNLEGLEKRYPLQLSGGQQQRVALARMLAAQPGILMLDEPFSALDAHLKDRLARDLVRLFADHEGPVLYVSHDIDEAMRFCDRIVVMERGRIAETTDPQQLIGHARSEAGLRLSGCENLIRIERTGPYEVYVPAWGMRLRTVAPVAEDARMLGIRASHVCEAAPTDEDACDEDNALNVVVEEAYGTRGGIVLTLAPVAATACDERLTWRIGDGAAAKGRAVPPAALPQVGDRLRVALPPDRLILV